MEHCTSVLFLCQYTKRGVDKLAEWVFQQEPKATMLLFYFILQIEVTMMVVMSSVDTEQTDKQKISYFQFSLLFFYFQIESYCVALVLIEFDV